jgi:hypothetical protein
MASFANAKPTLLDLTSPLMILSRFPCQVVRNDEYVDQKDPLLGSVGYVAVKWLPHRGQTFFSLLSHNRVIPMSEADYFFVTEAESSGIYEGDRPPLFQHPKVNVADCHSVEEGARSCDGELR